MEIRELFLDEETTAQLIKMSQDWEAENNVYGYVANSIEHLEGRTIFGAYNNNKLVGYIFGKPETQEKTNALISEGTVYFEVEELYVGKYYRNQGIGKALFAAMQERVKETGIDYIFLTSANKDSRRIMNFYLNEVGMNTQYAVFFKKI
jgi:ribosomal protein S18 acetylase RimI-like enzyme